MNPQNTVFDAKVTADMKHFSFKVIDGDVGKPVVEVVYEGETKKFVSCTFAPFSEKMGYLLSYFRLLKKSPP